MQQLSKLRQQLLLDAINAPPQPEVFEVCGQLRANKHVPSLELRNVTDSELLMVMDSIPNYQVPSLIILDEPRLSPSGVFILKCLLQSSAKPVTCLSVHGADPTMLVPLLQCLSAFPPSEIPHLEQFKLIETSITNDVAHEISNVLSKNTLLKTLEISHLSAQTSNIPRLDGPMTEILCTGLGFNKTLETLNLAGQFIANQGAVALANALSVNNSLLRLNVHRNGIGNKGAIALAKALQGNTSLKHVDLSKNSISGAGYAAFKEPTVSNNNREVKLDDLSWIGRIELSLCLAIKSCV